MGMYFQDDFWEAISTLPMPDRNACAGALLSLYFDGEEDTTLTGVARGFYVAFRQRVLLAKEKAKAGSKGGKKRARKLKASEVRDALAPAPESNAPSKPQAEPQAASQANDEQNRKQSAKQTGEQTDKQTASTSIKSERERECETEIQPVILPGLEHTPDLNAAPGFGLRCLKTLNEVLGTAYGQLPPTCAKFLAGMEGRYTDAQVRRMIEYKRDDWQGKALMRKHLTASTLLSPDHFESYMHQSMQEGGEDGAFEQFADAI